MNNLECFRTMANVDRKLLSDLMNITVHTYHYIERGRLSLSYVKAYILAKAYNIEINQLTCIPEQITDSTKRELCLLFSMTNEERNKTLSLRVSDDMYDRITPKRSRQIIKKAENEIGSQA